MKGIIEKLRMFLKEKEITAKFLCLVLSVILWGYLSTTSMGELRFRVPLDYTHIPTGLIVSEMPVKNVVAVVEGDKEHLRNVTINNLQAYVDFGTPQIGKPVKYRIRIIKSDLPEGINITLEPKRIALTVEKRVEKRVKVIPTITGDVKDGSVVGRIRIAPDYVVIAGPVSRMSNLDYVYTEDISVDGETSEVVREVHLKKDRIQDMEVAQDLVKVSIPIVEYGNLYGMLVPVLIRNMDAKYNYMLDRAQVKVYIRTPGQHTIPKEDINAFVDTGQVMPDLLFKKQTQDTVERELPMVVQIKGSHDGAEVVSIMPEKVIVTIKRR